MKEKEERSGGGTQRCTELKGQSLLFLAELVSRYTEKPAQATAQICLAFSSPLPEKKSSSASKPFLQVGDPKANGQPGTDIQQPHLNTSFLSELF